MEKGKTEKQDCMTVIGGYSYRYAVAIGISLAVWFSAPCPSEASITASIGYAGFAEK